MLYYKIKQEIESLAEGDSLQGLKATRSCRPDCYLPYSKIANNTTCFVGKAQKVKLLDRSWLNTTILNTQVHYIQVHNSIQW